MTQIPPTVFPSVDAAMKEMLKTLPVIKMANQLMRKNSNVDPKLLARNSEALAMLEDEKGLRKTLESLKRSDGSVHFSYTPEAWKLLRESIG